MKKYLLNPFNSGTAVFSFLLLMLTFMSATSTAQITITAGDFPHAGMLVVTNIDSTTALSPGSAGTGQVWDFSNLVVSYDDSTLYTMPGSQPGAANHAGANLVTQDLDSDINFEGGYNFIYYKTTNNGWMAHGQELKLSFFGISIRWHMFYEPPALILPLPLSYNTSNNQNTTWKLYAATEFNGSVLDSVLTINHTIVSQQADASGTMITPEGSFEALRVYEHTEIIDSSFKYNASSGWVFDKTGFTVLNTYRWFANGIGELGAYTVDGKSRGGSFSFYKSSTIVGTPELPLASQMRIYPNPASDYLNIESDDLILRSEVYSLTGKLMLQNNAGNRIDVTSLSPGTYMLKVYTPGKAATQKFIRQ